MKKHYTKARMLASFIFLFLLSFFSAQLPKLDRTFRAILDNKQDIKSKKAVDFSTGSTIKLKDIEISAKNSSQVFYSAIIYTKNAQVLKDKGINIQAEYPSFVTALVTVDDLEVLQSLPEVTAVKAPRNIPVNNEIAVAQSGAALLHNGALNNTKYIGKGVLVGIIDTGIDWTHPDFRDPADQTKSRILKLWDQTLSSGAGNPPANFSYGREYTKADIEAELAGTGNGYVREMDIHGHGTHVAGTAAGNGAALSSKKFAGMAPGADLVIVKGGDGSFSETNVINAVKYFQTVATSLNRPIVVNMSLGGQFSAHDGSGPQEQAIDNFTKSGPGRVVVLSAGNDNGDNIHSRNVIAPGESSTITLIASSNTSSSDILEYILYSDKNTDIAVEVTNPDGNKVSVPTNSSISEVPFGSNDFLASAENLVDSNNNNRFLDFYVGRANGSTKDTVGNWIIKITNNGTDSITTDGWLVFSMKDTNKNPLIEVDKGDSQYFIGTPASASTAITVASYAGRLSWYSNSASNGYGFGGSVEGIAPYSSIGPLRNGNQKPDVAATGHFIGSALPSNLVKPKDPYNIDGKYYQVMSGTSMASPVVAGAVALLLEMKPNASAQEVKNLIINNTQKDNATGTVPNTTWGFGKLDVFQSGASLLNIDTKRKTYTYENLPYNSNQSKGIKIDATRFAVRFTPDVNGKLGGFYINTWAPAAGITNYTVEVRSDKNGLPGDLVVSKTIPALNVDAYTWNYFDLTDLNVNLKSGADFHIVMYSSDASAAWSVGSATIAGGQPLLDAKAHLSTSGDNGSTWIFSPLVLRFRSVVYGKDATLAVDDSVRSAFDIQVYPNPTSDILNIKLDKAQKSTFKIFDLAGKLVKESSSLDQTTEINISSLPKGIYIININTGKESVNKKIIKN